MTKFRLQFSLLQIFVFTTILIIVGWIMLTNRRPVPHEYIVTVPNSEPPWNQIRRETRIIVLDTIGWPLPCFSARKTEDLNAQVLNWNAVAINALLATIIAAIATFLLDYFVIPKNRKSKNAG